MPKRIVFAVDDEPLTTRLIQVNLERAGYEVTEAHNGLEAWETLKASENLPDLILLDVTMPYMDGFELVQELRANPKTAHIPVIMLTARNRDVDFLRAQALGVTQYLSKPVHPTELVACVEEVLGAS